NLDTFNEESLWDDEVRNLMDKVNIYTDDEVNQAYPEKWGANVKVHLKNGETVILTTEYPKGDPENNVTKEDLYNKFMALSKTIDKDQAKEVADNILSLEDMDDLGMLFPYNVTVK